MRFNKRYYKHLELPYEKRHIPKYQKKYGVWRWRGMAEYREIIIPLLEGKIVDFGGALGPIGYGADIVDALDFDIHMKPVPYAGFHEVPYHADCIFTSHTLEHVDNLTRTLIQMSVKLKPGGYLMAHLPSIRGIKYWHPAVKKEHKRLFKLSTDSHPHDLAIVDIDTALEQFGFTVDIAEYCGDECIMVVARK